MTNLTALPWFVKGCKYLSTLHQLTILHTRPTKYILMWTWKSFLNLTFCLHNLKLNTVMQNWKLTEIPEGKYVCLALLKNVPIQQHCWSVGRKIKVIWYNKGLQGDINSAVELWVWACQFLLVKVSFFQKTLCCLSDIQF